MKRQTVFVLAAMIALVVTLFFLPVSSAKRDGARARSNERKAHAAKEASAESVFFKPARQQGAEPVVGRAVKFAESAAVRDFAPMPDGLSKSKTLTGNFQPQEKEFGEGGPFEINEGNREILRHEDENALRTPDQALSSKGSHANAPSPNPPNPPSLSFEGQSIADTIAIGQGFLPPDTNGDVGPNHYVQTVNVSFRIWDKAGNPLTPVASLNTLFGPLGGACGSSEDGDPIVLYDQLADRWMISQFCTVANPNNHQLIAISKTGNPTGSYYLYDFMMPNNKFNDYPHFGMWPDAYYMTDNQFNQAGTAFLQDGVFAFDRNKLLHGDPAASFIYFDTAVLFPPGTGINGTDGIGGMLPADMDGYIPPAAGAPCPFAYFQAGENAGEPGDQLRIFDFHADFTVPANSTFTERTGSPLVVAAFDPIPVPNTRNVVPQPAPSTAASFLDAISDRLMFRLSYRNLGTNETLVLNHTVNAATNPVFRAGVRWYQLNRATPAGAFTIGEQQTWAPADTEHRWMGSAANNFQGDLAVAYSTSSATVFPSIRYAARLGTDTPGTGLVQGETSIIAGAGSQTSTSGRWGDYSDLTVDPSDDCTFWYTQEYYPVSSEPGNTTAPWHTRISKFAPGPCTTSPRGTISGTVTSCQTGLPVPNAFVTISGGFSRATDAAGTYSAIVTPGTYNVSITGANYDTASTSGVVIGNGGSATFNACLNGTLKQPVADTASVTADSCNSNGAIDPNEQVTVTLGVKNTGTLNTVNLVGTLQATGGVTSPSGPQTYGVVVANGATVFRSFTFTAGNLACGAPIVLSLQLQDGATDLGTATYNFTTGTIAVSNYSTGNISTAIPDSPAPAINIPISVADVMTLSDVNVSFRINHTFDGDLTIALVHPDNTVIPLVTNRGSDGVNFGTGPLDCSGVPTVIDDQAPTAISAGSAPYTVTSFRPESPLSALNGKPSNGTWNLRIQDTAAQDTGTVGCVKLELNKRNVCCGALINAAPPPVITAESVSPANNAADPEETVTVNLSLVNIGGTSTSNLVATLQPTGGVAGPSGPQNYGVVVNAGPAVTRPFTFAAQGACGSTITLTLALQDGATNLGTVTYTMTLGALSISNIFTENFDGVSAPALPAGWVTAATGGETAWVTSVTNPNSAPNDAFAPDVATVGNTTLDTPTINVPAAGGQLTFKNLYNMEAATSPTGSGFDGMVLEISINGGAFGDITTGGNAFIAGGYNRTISGTFSSPIAGRLAWSALSGGTTAAPTYITSTINLPAAAAGQPIKLRWRAATDSSAVAAGAAGVRIDNIQITGSSFVCNSQSCTITAPTSITIPPGTCGTVVNYVPAVQFTGACGAVVGPNPLSGSFFGIGTTTVFVRGTRADASFTDASFPVTVQESETQATGLGANVTNNYCNTTVNYTAVTGAGSTTVVDAPQQTLPPPYVHCASCPELNITTTSSFVAPVTTCITMPASTDFATFTHLRILHGEPGLVNRTVSTNFTTRTICARTNTVSPFVVVFDPNAPTAAGASVSGQIVTAEGAAMAGVTVRLSGPRAVTTITDSNGNYHFDNLETNNFYTVVPAIANYHFSPANRSFSLGATKTDAIFTASPDAAPVANAIDTSEFFVRQQYLDFLGREPDQDGFEYWTAKLNQCNGEGGCLQQARIDVSAAFFMSREFEQSGSFVYRLYAGTLGRQLSYAEFAADRQQVVGGANLGANKATFTNAFVGRTEFTQKYQANKTAESFVDALLQTLREGGVELAAERSNLITRYNSGGTMNDSRAAVVRDVADNVAFSDAVRNPSFVLMEYFGYLHRDMDQSGYDFWLGVLNNRDPQNYRGMVCSFTTSLEYQRRFGTVITRSNADCSR
jgi:subtilisin-like proprotein convertase family protein